MKQKIRLWLTALTATLLTAGFFVSTVSAASCFTDVEGHWAETFICWLKSNGITSGYADGSYAPNNSITRAEMAVMLQKMRTTGGTTIVAGPAAWQINGNGNNYIDYYIPYAEFRTPSVGIYGYLATVSVPNTLYNTGMYLDGMRLCYDATNGAYIDEVRLYLIDGSDGSASASYFDTTNRSDELCRTYGLPATTQFHADDFIAVYISANFSSTSQWVHIRSLNINLHPSPTGTTVLKTAAGEDTIMEPYTEEP